MHLSKRASLFLTVNLTAARLLLAQTPDVEAIMSQVAAHQDHAEQARAQYTYTQKIRVRAIHSNGKLSREESCVYNAVPNGKNTKKDLVECRGRYPTKDGMAEYHKSGEPNPERKIDIDASILPGLRDGLVSDTDSKDGLGKDLFPLTTVEEKKYSYELEGEQQYRGEPVYRIKFWPKKQYEGFDDDQTVWAGEALVDKADLQPISVTTRMAKGLPLVVKTILGTNLHQLGFTVSYRRFDNSVYFPVSYGGEFDVRALFFYKRTFTISMENTDFRRGEAKSTITFERPR